MGYTTDFYGRFELNKELDEETFMFLKRFNETRRMKFDPKVIGQEHGVDGEFFVGHHQDFSGFFAGQVERDFDGLVEYNTPPRTQPGLWCQWVPSEDRKGIEWDGGEKFYHYTEWLQYIITNFLQPKGYILNGQVEWAGEDRRDNGVITVKNNVVNALDEEDEIAMLRKENEELKAIVTEHQLLKDEG